VTVGYYVGDLNGAVLIFKKTLHWVFCIVWTDGKKDPEI
jgi:hypothetical protein